jgi:hypothetical protein
MGEFLAVSGFTFIMFLPKLLELLDRWSIGHFQTHQFIHEVDTVSLIDKLPKGGGVPYFCYGTFIRYMEV